MKNTGSKGKVGPCFDPAALQPLRELFHYFIDLPLVYSPAREPVRMFGLEMGEQQQSILNFEVALGRMRERIDYDAVRLKKAKAQKRALRSRLHGLYDLTVPVMRQGLVTGYLLIGPYRKGIPSARRLEETYRDLTGRQAHPLDVEFIQFVKVVLGTLELSPSAEGAMVKFLEATAQVISGGTDPRCRAALEKLCWETLASELPHRYWMLSAMGANRFLAPARWEDPGELSVWERRGMGFERPPDCALALLPKFNAALIDDPVGGLLHKARFEREVFSICRSWKNMTSGPFSGTVAVIAALGKPPGSAEAALAAQELAVRLEREIRRGLGIETVAAAGPVTSPGGPLFGSFEVALKKVRGALAGKSRFEPKEGEPSVALLLGSKRKLCLSAISLRSEETLLEGERFLGLALRVSQEDGELRHWIYSTLSECLLTLHAAQPSAIEAQLSRWRLLLDRCGSAPELAGMFQSMLPQVLVLLAKPGALAGHQRMEAALRKMDVTWQHPPSLRDLARQSGYAEAAFSRAFKRHVGHGYHEAVRKRRLKEAERLLRGGRLKLTQVAEHCGFSSLSQFDRAFRGAHGVAPTAWRRSNA